MSTLTDSQSTPEFQSTPECTSSPQPAEPRVALITGAARGIGASIAAALHASGHRVALLDRDGPAADAVARGLDAGSATAISLSADVDDGDQLAAAVATVAARWRSPDILVNNAARTVTTSLWDVTLREWDETMATNLRSVLIASRLCAPAMRERRWGRIVNLASLAGQQGSRVAGPHYAAAKAGVLVLTKMFAQDLAPYGVTVNAVAPAAVVTPAMDGVDPESLRTLADAVPVGRLGRPAEVAALVRHLVGDDAGYITGATFDVNGGLFMR
ncbi:SDR family oxidoreductase [Catenulispora sp. NL8]|uniref:SDR family oxidoreductase n=1 Tax=Catenulispora pinistramenti TaxID=2705254 RepID=A0ABS5L711_9ACTN|nr:SDR family NAD(P)-dependent oxidoreductase [Catenulispora pinistramenti]MBS2554092.1 SDR family oxidoreductase [Catenulispora pinistramenti]